MFNEETTNRTRLSKEDIDNRIKERKLWMRTKCKEGKHTTFSNCIIENIDLSGYYLRGLDFHGSRLENVNLSNVDLSVADLSGTEIINCNLHGTNFKESNINNSEIFACRIEDVDMSYTDLRNSTIITEIYNTNFNYTNMNHSHLKCATLVGCTFKDTSLRHAVLDYVRVADTELSKASLNSAVILDIEGLNVYSVGNNGNPIIYIPKYDKVFAEHWTSTLDGFLKQGLEMEEEKGKIEKIYEFFKVCR
ncbi:hypothetical protein TwortDSMZ_190 [Staphylococcus phage Twort]|uniref:Pentapeptide repeat-containing protein n=2 Tax=Staphylococcus phage Twort (strain DSM 17442 / HER 48) TaxID=2908167 RepID=A0A6H0X521_BPTWO|nr:ORF044 [Staphylococcus phage Twort]AAX92339.1 ORF044 [Staphylococcus phage Twort]QIW89015.1 hypothetical protein TwortDSMZ_001 [Staphylococcus phage Twort]QIW89186.1 hypothetical protein TwortDSMZ_190 [Staphylococcus phage Twort]